MSDEEDGKAELQKLIDSIEQVFAGIRELSSYCNHKVEAEPKQITKKEMVDS